MKKRIDEKGRLFGKVSVIDLAVVLLVLVVAAGVFLKFFVLGQTTIGKEMVPVTYTLEVQNVRQYSVDAIRVGDTVFVDGTEAGTIRSVTAEPYMATSTAPDGTIWRGEVPERYTLSIQVEGKAVVDEGVYLVARTIQLSVGNASTVFSGKFFAFSATVKEIVCDG